MQDKKAILILEDEKMLSKALKIMLESEGFEVHILEDGCTAEEEFSRDKYDLVLLDLVVPCEEGLDVLTEIRKKDSHVPVFILSNLSDDENKREAKARGANEYFVKSDTLLSELTEHIKDRFK